MVLGTSKKKQFQLMNTGEMPLNFEIEQKYTRRFNLRVDPEKITKLPPGEVRTVTII